MDHHTSPAELRQEADRQERNGNYVRAGGLRNEAARMEREERELDDYVEQQMGGPEAVAKYEAYCDEEAKRGELAGSPHTLPCYDCARESHPNTQLTDELMVEFEREVVALGLIVEAHRDPTQTYRLVCGHTTI